MFELVKRFGARLCVAIEAPSVHRSLRPGISDQHVGSSGVHRDESAVLRLDGIAAR